MALSLIHSREYQTELENIYLDALALTFERFRFDVQFIGLGGRRPSSDVTFESIPAGENSVLWRNRIGMRQLLPTGGQWLVEFANNTLWLFAGSDTQSSASTLSYSIVQPLLLNGGRRFVLEALTQTERGVLYSLRDFARYRMGFFVNTVAGSGLGSNVTAGGGAGGTAGTTGYLALLRQRQQIVNQRNNIRQIQENLARLRAQASERPEEISEIVPNWPAGLVVPPALQNLVALDADNKLLTLRGDLTEALEQQFFQMHEGADFQRAARELLRRWRMRVITLQVAQLESQLNNSRINLLTAERNYQDTLDRFKLQIGLPTDMAISLDEGLLKPFELIDARIFRLQDRLKEFSLVIGEVDDRDPPLDHLKLLLKEIEELRTAVKREALDVVQGDIQVVTSTLESRLGRLPTDEDRTRVRENLARDLNLFNNVQDDFAKIEAGLKRVGEVLSQPNLPAAVRRTMLSRLADTREDLLQVAQGASVVQIGLRVELIELNPFEMDLESTMATGLESRVDLMNARAQVMDARRHMEVAANRLQAMLDLVAEGDINTKPLSSGINNPFDFRRKESSFRAGLSFTTPVQLVQERNAYRASQIAYQRARRAYMRAEDQVKLDIRLAWRQLDTLKQNFEIAKQGIRYAAVQLDTAVEQSTAPVTPGTSRNAGSQGLSLLNALNAVLQAQNNLIGIWVDYETNRLNIHRDMGIMEIDPRGFWTDEFYQKRLATAPLGPLFGPPPASDLSLPPHALQQDSPHAPRALSPAISRIQQVSGTLPAGSIGSDAGRGAALSAGASSGLRAAPPAPWYKPSAPPAPPRR